MKRKLCLTLFFLSIFIFNISCKPQYDLRTAQSAAAKIENELKNCKIVFLGEGHTDVYPCVFLKENLQRFYNAGLRYIFFEGESDNYLYNPENTWFFIYPAWGTWAHKFEIRLLYEEIKRINRTYLDDPIICIWAEETLNFTEDEFENRALIMNKRDKIAQKTIIDTLNNADSDKKALVFYGDAHGKKESVLLNKSSAQAEWKMLGSYLNDSYRDQFKTFDIFQFNTNKYRTVIYNSEKDCVVTPETLESFLLDGANKEYDYYCLTPIGIYGVPNVYVPEEINLRYLLSFENQKDSRLSGMSVWSKKSQLLLTIYYLKYYFGDEFKYDFTCSDEQLSISIINLQKKKITTLPYDLSKLEKYIEVLYSYGWLENYLLNPANDNRIKYIMNNMVKAKEINPRDIWPQYWISYFSTEKAMYSGRKKEYRKALSEWKELLKNDLVYASPVLKLIYKKMAFCEQQLGNYEGQHFYSEKGKKVSSLLDFDYKEYVYFGY